MKEEELKNRFQFHPATDDITRDAHEYVRRDCLIHALALNDALPEGREKSTAISKLEEVMFWANAAIAREGK